MKSTRDKKRRRAIRRANLQIWEANRGKEWSLACPGPFATVAELENFLLRERAFEAKVNSKKWRKLSKVIARLSPSPRRWPLRRHLDYRGVGWPAYWVGHLEVNVSLRLQPKATDYRDQQRPVYRLARDGRHGPLPIQDGARP